MRLNIALGAVSMAQIATNLALHFVVLSIIGAGSTTDAYMAAQAVPVILSAVLLTALQSTWQPRLSVATGDLDCWKAERATAQGQALILFGGSAFVLVVSAKWWIGLLFPGLSEEQGVLARNLLVVLLPATVFNGLAALATAAERARERFIGAEVAALVVALLAIAAALVSVPNWGIEAAAWILFFRSAGLFLWISRRSRVPAPHLLAAWREKAAWGSVFTILAGSSVYKTGPLVDRYWASQTPTGGMTAFGLVQLGFGALATVLEKAICLPYSPRLARLANEKQYAAMQRIYRDCIRRTTFTVGAVALGLILARAFWEPAVHLLFKIDAQLSSQMWWMALMLIGYLHVAISGTILVASLYAMNDTHRPTQLLVIGFVLGIGLKAVAFSVWGLVGLAAATSLYQLLNLSTLWWRVERLIRMQMAGLNVNVDTID